MFLGSGWGTANSTFGRKIDSQGDLRNFEMSHGSVGLTLDYFVKEFKVNPSHIKIDVDGNELLVLKGAHETLSSANTESLLIELCTTLKEYEESIRLIESYGFHLAKKGIEKKNTLNHIYLLQKLTKKNFIIAKKNYQKVLGKKVNILSFNY